MVFGSTAAYYYQPASVQVFGGNELPFYDSTNLHTYITLSFPNWSYTDNKPILRMIGTVDPQAIKGPTMLTMLVNGQPFDQIELKGGDFSWLSLLYKAQVKGDSYTVQFINQTTIPGQPPQEIVPVKVRSLRVEGLSPEHTTWPVSVTQQYFSQQGTQTIAQLNVPSNTEIVQLPILYYPDKMLDIQVDGKRVDYFPPFLSKLFIFDRDKGWTR